MAYYISLFLYSSICQSLHLSIESTPQFLPLMMLFLIVAVFIVVLVSNRMILRRVRQRIAKIDFTTAMMQKAVETSENEVVRYDLSHRYIYRLFGSMFPEEGVTVDEWKSHVHPDDLEETLEWFRQIIYGGLKRAEFYYRWNFDFTGRHPQWGYLHNISVPEYQKDGKCLANIISTLKDETKQQQQEEDEQKLTQRYKLIFENSIIGLSFYTPDGWLMDANKMMRDICHFDKDDFDEFFSHTNLFDQSPFRECCNKENLEELWICHQSIVPERDIRDYLETRLHPIRNDEGQVVYLAIATRNVSQEREMYLQAKLNDVQIQQANEKIRAYEEELNFMMEACEMRVWRASFAERKVYFYKGLSKVERELTFDEYKSYFFEDSSQVASYFDNPEEYFCKPASYLCHMRPVFHEASEVEWNQIDNIPVFDDDGTLTGCFGLIRNITNMMQKQEKLKQETERANDSGRLKSVFLANMTHEIRTPLNAIVGFSDLLQAIESPDDKREMIRVIHNNCDMLLRLINDILVLSNFDANVMQLIPAKVDFSHEFDDICQSLQQRVQEPGVEFQKDNPMPSLIVNMDNGRIQQVITNFVTNAVKYTHQGHIRVGYRLESSSSLSDTPTSDSEPQSYSLYVYCEDTGSGIPKEKQTAIFERFVKLNDYIQGTGLGLSICKTIVEKCGGEIGVESEVGKGSTFWFRIPVQILEE